jgi:uncharacterized membrane protein
MPHYVYSDFRPNAVRPVECLKAGWELIKDQYWLFMGVCLVAILMGQLAPLGILMAPMMCGVYIVALEKMRGHQVEFSLLFKGFDFFGESLIALLLHLIPALVVLAPFVGIMFLGFILAMPDSRGGDPAIAPLIAVAIICSLTLLAILILISVLFTFAYPLIVDRKLSGVEAVKLSMKAGMANFWGLLGLLLLNVLLGFVGALFCYIGAILVLPVGFAANACAYREVFGLTAPETFYPPPPPGSFR